MLLRTLNALKVTYQAPINRPLYLSKLSLFPTYCFRLDENDSQRLLISPIYYLYTTYIHLYICTKNTLALTIPNIPCIFNGINNAATRFVGTASSWRDTSGARDG